MTITEPIPGNYGKADWVDYTNYWRDADASWIQDRSILRYATDASRNTDLPAPSAGQVVYNATLDILQLRSGTGAWKNYAPLPGNLVATQDTSAGVLLAHNLAAGKGVLFTPTDVQVNNPFKVLTDVFVADATGVAVKVGTKTAKLSTDAASLISDSPISAPSVTLTGVGTVFSAPGKTIAVGTVTADNATLAAANVTGVLTAGSATIGGVSIGTTANLVNASAGYVSQGGYHYGDASSALMRHRNTSSGALGSSYYQTTPTELYAVGLMRYFGAGNGIAYYDSGGTFRGWIAPNFYGDPGVAVAAEGSILIQ